MDGIDKLIEEVVSMATGASIFTTAVAALSRARSQMIMKKVRAFLLRIGL